MKLNKRTITAIVLTATTALLGLLVMQVYLLNNALQLKRQAFRQNVRVALDAVVQQLETREVVAKVVGYSLNDSTLVNQKSLSITLDAESDSGKSGRRWSIANRTKGQIPQIDLDGTDLVLRLPTSQHVRVMFVDSLGRNVHLLDEFKTAGKHELSLKDRPHHGIFQFTFLSDSARYYTKVVDGRLNALTHRLDEQKKRALIEKVLDDFSLGQPRPVSERINLATLDSLVHSTLDDREIKTTFAYGIVAADGDTVTVAEPPQMKQALVSADFRARLFPNDLFAPPSDLVLHFSNQDLYLLQKIGFQAGLSLILVLAVTGLIAYIIRTILKQRAFSERLTSFINNMTHEFKTPISTISLATETIKKQATSEKDQKLQRYAGIIEDENARMQNQVEKILQMAVIEEGDYELNLAPVNVHQIIRKAIQNVSLQVEKRKGRISASLKAVTPLVQADALHFSNVIANLLDNAIKYTRDVPEIRVATKNSNGTLKISIEDNGIGLDPEDQARVFDKYYRVPTGNLHDVKGFGLGLSYVKLLVEAHHGTIDLRSELNKGTVFDICLPVKHAPK
ncbi:HAMP domain-containing histidine kinase [bacterium]|nr:HAMP domain-containing histidine kinase [bacterium]